MTRVAREATQTSEWRKKSVRADVSLCIGTCFVWIEQRQATDATA